MGGRTPFSGIHPGSAIEIDRRFRRFPEKASVACVLTTNGSTPTHLMTCGHAFPAGIHAVEVFAALHPDHEPVVVGRLENNLLERREGRLDVALVRLTALGIPMCYAHPGPRLAGGVRAALFLDGETGWIHSARTGQTGPRSQLSYPKNREVRGKNFQSSYRVVRGIRSNERISNPGDSGTVLHSLSSPYEGFGLCTGADELHSYFEPLERAIYQAGRVAGLDLRVFG